MNVVFGFPPNYAQVAAVFPVKGREVFFAWGNTVYVTNSLKRPSDAIMAHEEVHGRQQCDGLLGLDLAAAAWWERYIADPAFRLDQELPAHAAELAHRLRGASGRNDRRRLTSIVAHKLASPVYGGLISKDRAKDEILRRVEAINASAPAAM